MSSYSLKRRLRFEFKKEDAWVGVFWRWSKNPLLTKPHRNLDVWVCLLPMLPLHYSSRATR